MKRVRIFIVAVLIILLISPVAFAFKLGGREMFKNGTGRRTYPLISTIYYATLYVPEELRGKSGTEILEANAPMSIVILIDSGLITRDKFLGATEDGFKKAEASGYSTAGKQALLNMFTKDIELKKGDVVYFHYIPGTGMIISLKSKENGKTRNLGTAGDHNLKKALFSIWLGPKPVQEGLKNGMLGN